MWLIKQSAAWHMPDPTSKQPHHPLSWYSLPGRVRSCSNQPLVTMEHVLFAPQLKTPPHLISLSLTRTHNPRGFIANSPHTHTSSTIKINTRGMSHLEAVISKKIPFGRTAASKDHRDTVVMVPTGWQAVHHPPHSINDTLTPTNKFKDRPTLS